MILWHPGEIVGMFIFIRSSLPMRLLWWCTTLIVTSVMTLTVSTQTFSDQDHCIPVCRHSLPYTIPSLFFLICWINVVELLTKHTSLKAVFHASVAWFHTLIKSKQVYIYHMILWHQHTLIQWFRITIMMYRGLIYIYSDIRMYNNEYNIFLFSNNHCLWSR